MSETRVNQNLARSTELRARCNTAANAFSDAMRKHGAQSPLTKAAYEAYSEAMEASRIATNVLHLQVGNMLKEREQGART